MEEQRTRTRGAHVLIQGMLGLFAFASSSPSAAPAMRNRSFDATPPLNQRQKRRNKRRSNVHTARKRRNKR